MSVLGPSWAQRMMRRCKGRFLCRDVALDISASLTDLQKRVRLVQVFLIHPLHPTYLTSQRRPLSPTRGFGSCRANPPSAITLPSSAQTMVPISIRARAADMLVGETPLALPPHQSRP